MLDVSEYPTRLSGQRPAFASIPQAILAKYITVNAALMSNVFSLGGTGVFERALREANFREVSVQAVPIQFHFTSMDTFLQQLPHNL